LLAFVVFLLAILLVPIQAHAEQTAEESRWTIAPVPTGDPSVTKQGYFVYNLKAGTRTTGQVVLENLGTKPVTIALAAVDAQTGQTGGSAFSSSETAPAAVGKWISLETRHVTLEPGTARQIEFVVEIPGSVDSGQYLAGITAEELAAPARTEEITTEQGFNAIVEIKRRYVIGVQTDIPGSWQPSLRILEAHTVDQAANTMLTVRMRNDGGTFLKPEGTITIVDVSGTTILEHAVALDTFVTGTDLDYTLPWPGVARAGTYRVKVEMRYTGDKTATFDEPVQISREIAAQSEQHAQTGESTPTVQQPAAQSAPGEPWMLYVVGTLLLMIVILQIANFLRGRAKKRGV
jgi:hypothetical protein